jgi:hypothetical protein
MVKQLIRRFRRAPKRQTATCTIGVHDLFPRGFGCWKVSLLAKDALRRAGIDRSKPHGWTFDAKKGTVTFTQVKEEDP